MVIYYTVRLTDGHALFLNRMSTSYRILMSVILALKPFIKLQIVYRVRFGHDHFIYCFNIGFAGRKHSDQIYYESILEYQLPY